MANEMHFAKLKEGPEAWNLWRRENPDVIPDLSVSSFPNSNLNNTNLAHADLTGMHFYHASFVQSDLSGANLSFANSGNVDFTMANLSNANLANASLNNANFSFANLEGADLRGAGLPYAIFANANCSGTELMGASVAHTNFSCLNLDKAKGLDQLNHIGPSFLPSAALRAANGKLPEAFLRGCGLSHWEILSAKLYDPGLSAGGIAEIQQQIFDERAKGFFLCGAFISYAHSNSEFTNHLYTEMKSRGINVWLDCHDMVAGPLAEQIDSAIRLNDIVLFVLSEHSLGSDWAKWELEQARSLKKKWGKDVLCPIALDDTWKIVAQKDPSWNVISDYHVLDFSDWKNPVSFEREFNKLIEGIKRYYIDGEVDPQDNRS